jgi:hypothetical protein
MELAPVTPETVPASINEQNRGSSAVRRLFVAEPPVSDGSPPRPAVPTVVFFAPVVQHAQFCPPVGVPVMLIPTWAAISANCPFVQVPTPASAFATIKAVTLPHPQTIVPLVVPDGPEFPFISRSQVFPLVAPFGGGGTMDAGLQIATTLQANLDRATEDGASALPSDVSENVITLPSTTSVVKTTDSSLREEKPVLSKLKFQGKFSSENCARWIDRLAQVKAFAKRFGHCRIPQVFPEDPDLGRWAKRQRYQYKLFMNEVPGKSTTSKERIAVLDELGFCWDIQEEQWEDMYVQLVRYVRTYGDTKVPTNKGKHKVLGAWVNRQRKIFQRAGTGTGKTSLSAERFRRLDAIGFDWYTLPPRQGEDGKGKVSRMKKLKTKGGLRKQDGVTE